MSSTKTQLTVRRAVSEQLSQEETYLVVSTAGVTGPPQERRGGDAVGGTLSCHCIVYFEFHTMYNYCSSEQGKNVRPPPLHTMLHQAGIRESEGTHG